MTTKPHQTEIIFLFNANPKIHALSSNPLLPSIEKVRNPTSVCVFNKRQRKRTQSAIEVLSSDKTVKKRKKKKDMASAAPISVRRNTRRV
jgi:RNase H-fold protein (predicted Holliday junction resolvase)